MRLFQFCKNELQAQYSFIYQALYIAKKYMHSKTKQNNNNNKNNPVSVSYTHLTLPTMAVV